MKKILTQEEAKLKRRLRWEQGKTSQPQPKKTVNRSVVSTLVFRVPKVKVLSEWRTLERVLNGMSISRYGDGEIKHMDGKRNVSQIQDDVLSMSLRDVFQSRLRNHMVAIPNVFNGRSFDGIADKYISSMQRRFGKKADLDRTYGSSYISRADLCGYLDHAAYWSVISEIWSGRDVVLVRGDAKRANPAGMMNSARNLTEIEIPTSSAWKCYPEILGKCMKMDSACRFILCAGPTATVLAYDLARRGRHAVDLGHLGLFYGRWVGALNFQTPKDLNNAQ